ncbi:MAG TPA: restriction endonuclease subunit S [Saprospiraceae bacterium]|nr:restriction endonuclease subunit S [Saprospiraceae bacterium]
MKWEKVEYNDVLEKIIGGGTPSKTVSDYWNGDIPWCSVKDMVGDKYQLYSTEDTITHSGLENSSTNLIQAGTVITSTRMGLGRAFINKVDMAINQDLKALIPNEKIDNKFLLWSIVNKKEEIEGLGIGSTVKGIRLDVLRRLKINLPPLPIQRRIASILSAYDDLIENNLKRIKLLEEKAFLRYKQIVREEQLAKYILSDFGDIITGKTPSTSIADYFGDDVPFIKTPDMHNQIFIEHTDQMLSELGAKSQEKKLLPPLSLCVSCIGTAGVVGITSKPSQTNQQINSIVFYEPKNAYFFYSLMSQMKEQLDALGSNGSTFTNVNKNKFENMEVFIPYHKVLNEFAEEFEAPFSLILTLQKQNAKLREARDILLPRLINGQIEV